MLMPKQYSGDFKGLCGGRKMSPLTTLLCSDIFLVLKDHGLYISRLVLYACKNYYIDGYMW